MIITAIRAFEGNLHDRQTIQPLWEQHESIVGQAPKELVVDWGGQKTSDRQYQEIDSRQTTEKRYSLSKAQEEEKVPTSSRYWPSQKRTSHARKWSDGRPVTNVQCFFGHYGVEFKEIHGITSSRCSFLLFQKVSIFSSKSFDRKNNLTATDKKGFLRSDYIMLVYIFYNHEKETS